MSKHWTTMPLWTVWSWMILVSGLRAQMQIDVTAPPYHAAGNGLNDDTPAILAAIAAAPVKAAMPGSSPRRFEHAATIVFPTPPKFYRVTQRIVVPSNKNIRFLGTTSHSARIAMDNPAEAYIFQVAQGDTQRAMIFEKLIFQKGGILLDKDTRRFTAIRDCVFHDTPDYAIATTGPGVVDVEVSRCQISECARGINIGFQQSDLWVISHCGFVRNRGIDLRIATSGVHVRDCDFEVRPASGADQPYVQLDIDTSTTPPFVPGNDVQFVNCRFGNEPDPPRDCVVIGPIHETSDSATGAIWFRDCLFRGAYHGMPSDRQGTNAIVLNMPTVGMHVEGCSFFPYTNLVAENYVTHGSSATSKSDYNYWVNNSSGATGEATFTRGGRGWYIQGLDAQRLRPASSGRVTQNLLNRTDNIHAADNWGKTGLSVTKNATGPDGVANSAYTLTRTAASSWVTSPASPRDITGPVVFSVWLKAGTVKKARLGIVVSPGGWSSSSPLTEIILTDRWERYYVVSPDTVRGTYSVYLFAGADDDATSTGDMFFANPQLEQGFEPSTYVSNPDSVGTALRAPQQFQNLVLGTRSIGYGSAAPTTDRHELGDMVFNTLPATTQPIGWVCTEAGTPGIWRPFGTIR